MLDKLPHRARAHTCSDLLQLLKHVTFSNWLYFAAALRAFSVVLGYAFPFRLHQNLFVNAKPFTDLTARCFSAWTTITCLVCVVTAKNPANVAMVQLCLSTFVVALLFFALELFVYRTTSIYSVATPFLIACESPHAITLYTHRAAGALTTYCRCRSTATSPYCSCIHCLVPAGATGPECTCAFLLNWRDATATGIAGTTRAVWSNALRITLQ